MYNATFAPSMDSTDEQRNSIDLHDGTFASVDDAVAFAIACSVDIQFYDAAGFKRGYVKRTGEWSYNS